VATRLRSSFPGQFLVLTLESDDGLPRIERSVLAQLDREIGQLDRQEFSGCIITGTEQALAVGADINELAQLTGTEAFEFSRDGQRVLSAIERAPLPVVAAIQGYCMGGGLDLALACHTRIATRDAVFAHPGGALGILTGWGGTQRLTRLVGRARALEMFASGRKLDASEAAAWGLVSRIAPPGGLMETAEAQITARSKHGFALP
jgi:enoyl-CoA hydratase/carnithine racemase